MFELDVVRSVQRTSGTFFCEAIGGHTVELSCGFLQVGSSLKYFCCMGAVFSWPRHVFSSVLGLGSCPLGASQCRAQAGSASIAP